MPHMAGHVLGLPPDENPTQGGPTGAATTPATKAAQDAAINAVLRDLTTYAITAREAHDALLGLGVDQARAAALLQATVDQREQQNKPGEPTEEGAGSTGPAAPEGTTATATAAPTPTGQSPGDVTNPFAAFSKPRETWALEEEESLFPAWSQWMSGQPFGRVNSAARRGLEELFGLAQAQFNVRPQDIPRAGDPDPPWGDQFLFRDFLRGGGATVSPGNIMQRLVDIHGSGGKGTDVQRFDWNRFMDENFLTYQTSLAPSLRGITPAARAFGAKYAQDIYNRFIAANPEGSFLDRVAAGGGNIFGAFT